MSYSGKKIGQQIANYKAEMCKRPDQTNEIVIEFQLQSQPSIYRRCHMKLEQMSDISAITTKLSCHLKK